MRKSRKALDKNGVAAVLVAGVLWIAGLIVTPMLRIAAISKVTVILVLSFLCLATYLIALLRPAHRRPHE